MASPADHALKSAGKKGGCHMRLHGNCVEAKQYKFQDNGSLVVIQFTTTTHLG